MRFLRSAALCLLAGQLALAASPSAAQHVTDRPLRVYLDCTDFYCDQDFFTQEIPWVDFVRDRQSADIHVLGTRQSTGGGGSQYTLELQGRGALEGQRVTLQRSTPADATESTRREALVEVVRLGLAPFAAATPAAPAVEFTAIEAADAAAPVDDPWNRWTFHVGVNSFMNGESQQRFLNASANTSASRVTDAWKIRLSAHGSLSESEYQLTDSTTYLTATRTYSGSALAARSVTPHWSVGGVLSGRRSTYANYDASVRLAPAVEYDVFPYAESTRRLLTFLYAVGVRRNDYRKVTIFGEPAETLLEQLLVVAYDVTQPWGNIDVAVHSSHYIAKFGTGRSWPEPQYNIDIFGGANLRLIRGLSFNLRGNLELVRGQIQLASEGLTEEEILTRQRELATAYRYFLSFGLSYRFGSIFSEIVNPRFDRLD